LIKKPLSVKKGFNSNHRSSLTNQDLVAKQSTFDYRTARESLSEPIPILPTLERRKDSEDTVLIFGLYLFRLYLMV
jgi:hypothetical protein